MLQWLSLYLWHLWSSTRRAERTIINFLVQCSSFYHITLGQRLSGIIPAYFSSYYKTVLHGHICVPPSLDPQKWGANLKHFCPSPSPWPLNKLSPIFEANWTKWKSNRLSKGQEWAFPQTVDCPNTWNSIFSCLHDDGEYQQRSSQKLWKRRGAIINKKKNLPLPLEPWMWAFKNSVNKKKKRGKKKVTATFDRVLAWFVLQTKS